MYRVAARWLILLLMVMNTIAHSHAQVSYQHFDANAGLPSNETYCAFEDKAGYMWFGTDHGVVKYNGYEFVTYTTSDGLTDNTVFDIKADDIGNLYFLTLNGGICYHENGKFMPHPMNDSITTIFRKQMPTSWTIDSNKRLWIGGIDEGFYKVDSNKISLYAAYALPQRTIPYVYVVTFKNGRYIYAMFLRSKFQAFADDDVVSVEEYKLDWDYLTITSTNFQLVKMPNQSVLYGIGQRVILLDKQGINSTYFFNSDKRLAKLKKLDNGEVWMSGINANIYKLNPNNDSKIEVIDSIADFNAASDISITSKGLYWITTVDKGIYAIPNLNIRNYFYKTELLKNKVTYLKAGAGKLFIPIKGVNLLEIDSHTHAKKITSGIGPTNISGITFKEQHKIVSNQSYPFLRTEKSPYLYYYFSKIIHLNGDTFIAAGTGGFAIVNNRGLLYSSRIEGFTTRVNEITQLGKNDYLIGTINGLYIFNIHSKLLTEKKELSKIRVTGISVIDTHTYAISTRGNGIFIYLNNKTYTINEKNGLISDLTESLLFEDDSTIWVASYNGISKICITQANRNNPTFKVYSYTTEDGLCSNQVNAIEKYNGYLWLATNEGVCKFSSTDLSTQKQDLKLFIEYPYINGEKFIGDLSTLSFSQNNLSIRYHAIYYNKHAGARYKIRLKGRDTWRYTFDKNIQYYGLPPGSYLFQVAAEDKYGRYASDIKELRFTIEPHFTQTAMFKGLIVLGLLAIVTLIIYLIFAYQRFKAQNIIKLLQSEFKALNYQINPHFIFNVLNSIQYYILRKDSDKAVHFLSSFSTLIRRIVSNSRQQYISVIEEVECLKDYLELEKLRLENKFDYELNIDSNVDIEQKTMLPMIIQPLVENSIWHGIVPLEERGKIIVDFKCDTDGALICTVDDNGVGINSTKLITKKEQNNLSLAMSNVKERLKIIGELNGSEWFINFMDKSELGNKERGTIVTIRFPLAK